MRPKAMLKHCDNTMHFLALWPQVYLARLRGGQRVVVKVQRPGLKELFDIGKGDGAWGVDGAQGVGRTAGYEWAEARACWVACVGGAFPGRARDFPKGAHECQRYTAMARLKHKKGKSAMQTGPRTLVRVAMPAGFLTLPDRLRDPLSHKPPAQKPTRVMVGRFSCTIVTYDMPYSRRLPLPPCLCPPDLKNIRALAVWLQRVDPKTDGAARDWVAIYDECSRILYQEIDYRWGRQEG